MEKWNHTLLIEQKNGGQKQSTRNVWSITHFIAGYTLAEGKQNVEQHGYSCEMT